ncbi:MAG: transposase [Nitrospirae bacterium]|nr:transposase [Nitrospirota bacterium]
MPRISRPVAVGYPHHITQRGNYRQKIFESDGDYLQYLEWLQQYSRKYQLKIWAYCLMSNHVHFIAVPMESTSLAKTFHSLHMRYSQYFNQKMGAVGHLWQGRFYSCVLNEAYLYAAVRYVENNPVRAKIVEKPDDHKWSSARSHVYKEADIVLSGDCYLTEQIRDWPGYLGEKEDDALINTIRSNTRTGRPCGDEGFIEKIEGVLGRRLKAMSKGRPKKVR